MGDRDEDPLGNARWVEAERLATHLDRILDCSAPHSAARAAADDPLAAGFTGHSLRDLHSRHQPRRG